MVKSDFNQKFESLTLIPLGYFEDLSPLALAPPPPDLGN